jgi:hypothetical protein
MKRTTRPMLHTEMPRPMATLESSLAAPHGRAGGPPSENNLVSSDVLKAVYAEAGQWVRMVNTIVWTAGTALFPLVIGALGLAFAHPAYRWPLAGGSLALYGFWMYVSYAYGHSAMIARQALMEIERSWGVLPASEAALYGRQGQVGRSRRGLPTLQRALFAVLLIAWAAALYLLRLQ